MREVLIYRKQEERKGMIMRLLGALKALHGDIANAEKKFTYSKYELSGRGFANLCSSYNGKTNLAYYLKKVRQSRNQSKKYPDWKTRTPKRATA